MRNLDECTSTNRRREGSAQDGAALNAGLASEGGLHLSCKKHCSVSVLKWHTRPESLLVGTTLFVLATRRDFSVQLRKLVLGACVMMRGHREERIESEIGTI